jgi:hypothetical protein
MTQFNKHFLNRGFRGYARINTIDPRRADPRPSALSAVFRFFSTSELFHPFSLLPAEGRAGAPRFSLVVFSAQSENLAAFWCLL